LGASDKQRASEGWLVVFDEDARKPWDQKLTLEALNATGEA
jgi:hypothetical protein